MKNLKTSPTKIVNIQDEVNPHFREVWVSDKPYNILKGGRNSFKSSVIALLLVKMMTEYVSKNEKANIVVIRKVANTIRDSVFNKIQWALDKFGYWVGKGGDFKTTISPFKIIHIATGSAFYFYGQDDFQKLKSNDIDDLVGVWYEEAAEFESEEEFTQTNATFMRQKHRLAPFVQFFWSYNPPRNPFSWINDWSNKMEEEEEFLVHHSSYLDDELGFTTAQMQEDINRIKRNDYDYYQYIYLGLPIGIGDNVYNTLLFNKADRIPKDERILKIALSIDTGYSVSATAVCAFALTEKGNVYLLDTDYYDPRGQLNKRSPLDHSKAIREFEEKIAKKYNRFISRKTVDSADGAIRNQYFNLYGDKLSPVKKKKKAVMIDNIIDLLAQGRFYYLDIPRNEIFVRQHEKYRWNEASIKNNPDNPEVVKEDDHTCDCFQYFVQDHLRDLKLKF